MLKVQPYSILNLENTFIIGDKIWELNSYKANLYHFQKTVEAKRELDTNNRISENKKIGNSESTNFILKLFINY